MIKKETLYQSPSSLNLANVDITHKYYWNIKGTKVFAPVPEVTVNGEIMNKITKTFLGLGI